MAFLWIAFGLGLLWLWLSGHWFGRVVIFLALIALGLAIYAATENSTGHLTGICIVLAGWPVSSAPRWVRARRWAISVAHRDGEAAFHE